MIKIRRATIEDAKSLSETIREEDRRELSTVRGYDDPERALADAISLSSFCMTGYTKEDGVLVIWGVSDIISPIREGCVWLIASKNITKYEKEFLRRSKDIVLVVQQFYDILYNLVDSRNELHINWLKWVGFSFFEDKEINGVIFKTIARFKDV